MNNEQKIAIAGLAALAVGAVIAIFSGESEEEAQKRIEEEQKLEIETRCTKIAQARVAEKVRAGDYSEKSYADIVIDLKFEQLAAHYE